VKDNEPELPQPQTLQEFQAPPLSGDAPEPERASSPRKSKAPAKAAARKAASPKTGATKAGAPKKRKETR